MLEIKMKALCILTHKLPFSLLSSYNYKVSLFNPGRPQTYCVAKDDLELLFFLPLPPKY